MDPIARLDHAHVWHPFTQMSEWLEREPIVIVQGRGVVLEDSHGRKYLDGNSSIWTNLHGHRHPKLNAAIRSQLNRIAHSSALGLANEPASRLAAELVKSANWKQGIQPSKSGTRRSSKTLRPRLNKVFYSDDGSTALEVALKLAYEFSRRTRPFCSKPRFLSMEGAYHGDTIGAVSLGHIDLFHKAYGGMLFKTDRVMAPYCYRCPYNRARPERGDAREYRKCRWECVDQVQQAFEKQKRRGNSYAGFVYEPLMQGAAGMIPQPVGWLGRTAEMARGFGSLLIADEVMTGFGRTGSGDSHVDSAPRQSKSRRGFQSSLFASHHEGVQPDLLCLAKGLSGGFLPMAATLTSQEVFDAFLGRYEDFKTFFHGHSYTANQLGAAAGLASLELLNDRESLAGRSRLEGDLRRELKSLWDLPQVGDIRQEGCVAGIELVKDWKRRTPFDLKEKAGIRVCEAMSRRGVLTRPIGNVIVLMPPYCTSARQVRSMVSAMYDSIVEVFGGGE